ncbi:MAG: acyloxyacyl hydrolase [Bacteroidales bacterium]
MRYIVWLIFLLTGISAFSQDTTSNPVLLGLKPQYGYILPHTESIRPLSNSNPYGMELDYGWVLSRQSDWKRCNCYSRAGFSASFINFGNPEILGSAASVIMFAEPYLNYGSPVWMSMRMGVGPSYVTKVYDEKNNPQNLFFSSHLSFIIHMDFMLNFRLNEHWTGKIFGKYHHISNGGVEQPNMGINFPTFGVGMDYVFESPKLIEREPLPIESEGIVPSVAVFGSLNNVMEEDSKVKKRTFGYGFLVKGRHKIAKINALNIGFEGFWDGAVKEKSKGEREHRQFSILTGHDLIFGRFIFSQYWGSYLYAPYYEKIFFQRYSLTYNLTGNWRVGVNLKAHGEVAQNFNINVEYDLH